MNDAEWAFDYRKIRPKARQIGFSDSVAISSILGMYLQPFIGEINTAEVRARIAYQINSILEEYYGYQKLSNMFGDDIGRAIGSYQHPENPDDLEEVVP